MKYFAKYIPTLCFTVIIIAEVFAKSDKEIIASTLFAWIALTAFKLMWGDGL